MDIDENRQVAVEIVFSYHLVTKASVNQGKNEQICLTRSILVVQFTNWFHNALCGLHLLMEILVRIDKGIQKPLQHVLAMESHLYSTNYWID